MVWRVSVGASFRGIRQNEQLLGAVLGRYPKVPIARARPLGIANRIVRGSLVTRLRIFHCRVSACFEHSNLFLERYQLSKVRMFQTYWSVSTMVDPTDVPYLQVRCNC